MKFIPRPAKRLRNHDINVQFDQINTPSPPIKGKTSLMIFLYLADIHLKSIMSTSAHIGREWRKQMDTRIFRAQPSGWTN